MIAPFYRPLGVPLLYALQASPSPFLNESSTRSVYDLISIVCLSRIHTYARILQHNIFPRLLIHFFSVRDPVPDVRLSSTYHPFHSVRRTYHIDTLRNLPPSESYTNGHIPAS